MSRFETIRAVFDWIPALAGVVPGLSPVQHDILLALVYLLAVALAVLGRHGLFWVVYLLLALDKAFPWIVPMVGRGP